MEFATSIGASMNGLVVNVLDTHGARSEPLSKLYTKGLPNISSDRLIIDQDTSQWREVQLDDYLSGFELKADFDFMHKHAVYETMSGNLRVLIPALAVMRAFFRPAHYLLSKMFFAEGLDAVRYLNTDFHPPKVQMLAKRYRSKHATYGDLATPISWMSVFPSAMRFAASVHRHACDGRLAVELPRARIKALVQGRLTDGALRVTALNLWQIEALEPPHSWVKNHPMVIFRRQMRDTARHEIPARSDGSFELTNDEWRRVEHLVIRDKSRIRLDQRKILDGVISKMARGTSWRHTRYTEGKAVNARHAYRQWKSSGIWDEILRALYDMRAPGLPTGVACN